MMRRYDLAISLCFILATVPAVSAARYTELVVFGDSHSDTGNWLSYVPWWEEDPAFLAGRFSNGPVWTETLAERLAVALPVAKEAGGLNFAWGAARTGRGYDRWSHVSYPKLETQVAEYLARTLPTGRELFALFIGHNDFGSFNQQRPQVPVDSIRRAIELLAGAGARQLIVPRLHPLGRLPIYRGGPRAAPLNAITEDFNQLLDVQLAELEATLGVVIYRPDFAGLVEAAEANPAAYGLSDATHVAHRSNGTTVANPAEFMYWDSDHFTTTFYSEMAHLAFATILRDRDGDFNADGLSDGADLLAWQRVDATERRKAAWEARFGGLVSEPSAGVLTFLCAMTLTLGRYRRLS